MKIHGLSRPPATILALILMSSILVMTACGSRDNGSVLERMYRPPDSLLSQGLEMTAATMRELESAPLTDKELQNIFVEGVWYQRFLADTEFRRIDEYDYDNLRDYPRNTVFDVVLDLRDSSHFALAQTRADTLLSTVQAGFHRCYMPREELRMLILNGVNAYSAVVFEKREP